MIGVKIHSSYRQVIAICDLDLLGKKFEDNQRQLSVHENFFKEKEMTLEEVIKLMRNYAKEDATFNIVGPQSVNAALEAGIIDKDGVATVQGIPFALVLV